MVKTDGGEELGGQGVTAQDGCPPVDPSLYWISDELLKLLFLFLLQE